MILKSEIQVCLKNYYTRISEKSTSLLYQELLIDIWYLHEQTSTYQKHEILEKSVCFKSPTDELEFVLLSIVLT